MPFCGQCGKEITDEILMKNNGECDECFQEGNIKEFTSQQMNSQLPITNRRKCAYCQTMTDLHCQMCRKPLCDMHFHYNAEGKILCKECDVDNTGIFCLIGFVCAFFLIILFSVISRF